MGFIRSYFSFIFGTFCGIYIAQSYNVPNVERMAQAGYSMAKQMEERYRKAKTKQPTQDIQD
ncbi:unnamed protein product [Arabis nemorensis]|uniref:Uncharacterized protein n=1 Tax=Arabis nemorensis TaxID=586526 RepID=A0A565BZM9_9BRAS|nr:unnamed protein product [Arabis nemorensis]